VDRAHRRPRQPGDRRDRHFKASREALAHRKPANDNRIGLKGWIERVVALSLLIALAALLAWKVAS